MEDGGREWVCVIIIYESLEREVIKAKKMKQEKLNISAIIIAKNEENKIRECLESLQWVDEIVLIDSGSSDNTKQIAKRLGAQVNSYRGGGYSNWRNEGLKKARGNWVLYIDADERISPKLRSEISKLINSNRDETDRSKDEKLKISNYGAYAIPRINIVLGKEMKHGGWYPDYVKRLFKKDALKKWYGELHEEPFYGGDIGHLKNAIIHIKENNLSEMVEKTNLWSEIEAKLMFEAGHPKMNIIRFMSAMFREAWFRMIKKAGFLDGTEGIIYNTYQVWSKFVTYAKLWEMQIETKSSKLSAKG